METAGYQFEGNWHSGENIAWMTQDDKPGFSDEVAELHDGLMNSPGHRANILNPGFTEIGIGIEIGQFNDGGGELDSVMISQNFGHSDAEPVDPPTEPVDDVSTADDLWEMFDDMFDGYDGLTALFLPALELLPISRGRVR